MSARAGTVARIGAVALGAALFGALLSGWRVERGAVTGADVRLGAARHTQLDVRPGPGLGARATLLPSPPGGGIGGSLSVRNATGETLPLTLRATAESGALDRALRVRVHSGRRVVFTGTLAALRRGARLRPLASHATLALAVHAWIPASTRSGFQSRRERIVLSFVTRPDGRS